MGGLVPSPPPPSSHVDETRRSRSLTARLPAPEHERGAARHALCSASVHRHPHPHPHAKRTRSDPAQGSPNLCAGRLAGCPRIGDAAGRRGEMAPGRRGTSKPRLGPRTSEPYSASLVPSLVFPEQCSGTRPSAPCHARPRSLHRAAQALARQLLCPSAASAGRASGGRQQAQADADT